MSTAKRSRRRQSDARAAAELPASKRLKTAGNGHEPDRSGLAFLVDEDARVGRKLEARLTNGVPDSKMTRVDESRAVVALDTEDADQRAGDSQENALDISSDEEESEDDAGEGDGGEEAEPSLPNEVTTKPVANGRAVSDSAPAAPTPEDVDMDGSQNGDRGEPEEASFGDMLQAQRAETIDVRASFPDQIADRQALIPASGDQVLAAPSGTSLGTVLTQALKTNDKDLLESCFRTTDLPSIRATIQRLQSQHVAALLQRLAERIHRKPGRTGNLMVWVQWSLVAHGGFLAAQPEVMRRLKSLSQVLRDRANGLQPLLHLKGKLDLLSAQLELRRNIQAASRAANAEDDDDERGVFYVEGRDDDWSESDDLVDEADLGLKEKDPPQPKPKRQAAIPPADQADSDDDSDDMPNGVVHEGDDEEDSEVDEDGAEGMLDIEAEETSDGESGEVGSDEEADSQSHSDSQDESDPSDGESDASADVQPILKNLDRKR